MAIKITIQDRSQGPRIGFDDDPIVHVYLRALRAAYRQAPNESFVCEAYLTMFPRHLVSGVYSPAQNVHTSSPSGSLI